MAASSTDTIDTTKPISHPLESCEVMIAAITTPMPTAAGRHEPHERRLERQPLTAAGNHHARPLRGRIPALAAGGAARFALGVGLPVAVARGGGGHEARIPRTRGALGATGRSISPLTPVPGSESGSDVGDPQRRLTTPQPRRRGVARTIGRSMPRSSRRPCWSSVRRHPGRGWRRRFRQQRRGAVAGSAPYS